MIETAIDLVIEPRDTDLGEFTVRRALPATAWALRRQADA